MRRLLLAAFCTTSLLAICTLLVANVSAAQPAWTGEWKVLGASLSSKSWVGVQFGYGFEWQDPKWGRYHSVIRFTGDYQFKGNIPRAYSGYDIDNSRWWDWGDVEYKGTYYDQGWGLGLDFSCSVWPKVLPGLSCVFGLSYFSRTYYDIWWDTTLNKYWGQKDRTDGALKPIYGGSYETRKVFLYGTFDKRRELTFGINWRM